MGMKAIVTNLSLLSRRNKQARRAHGLYEHKRTSKKGGFYAWTAARMADVQGKREADSLYQAAEAMSIKNNMPYMTATILYHRSLLKGTPADVAADLKLRCKNAFELMGLPNNAKRCGE